MKFHTPDRHRHAPTSTFISVEIISNDAVDRLCTLRAVGGSNPQQTSRLLRAARVHQLAQQAANGEPLKLA